MMLYQINYDDEKLADLNEFKEFIEQQENNISLSGNSHIIAVKSEIANAAKIRDQIASIANDADLTECKIFVAQLTGHAAWHNMSRLRSEKIGNLLNP